MAESSRVAISFREQVDISTKSVGQYQYLNFEEETLKKEITKDPSKRILPNRENSGLIPKTQIINGNIAYPLQAQNFDSFFAACLRNSWVDVANGTGGGTIVAGALASNLELTFAEESGAGVGGKITLGSGITFNILLGQAIFVSNAADAENNGVFLVKAINGNELTVNSPLTNATYQTNTVIAGDRLRNGSTQKYFTIEREHQDVSKFFDFIGASIASVEITFEAENPVQVNFELLGKEETNASITSSTGTPLAAPEGPEFIVGDSVEGVFINYEAVNECLVQSFSLKIDNQSESRKAIAVFGPCAIRDKSIVVNGSTALLFTDFTYYSKYIDNSGITLSIITKDSLDNYYVFTLSRLQFATGNVNATDMDEEAPEEHEFSCSTDNGFTIEISKLTA